MHVFRLTPVPEHLGHSDWQRSTHKGRCLVYAKNEEQARDYAKAEFDIAAEKSGSAHLVPKTPWVQPERVECTKIPHTGGDLASQGTVIPDEPV